MPEWLENYDHTKSLSLPRLLESFDITTEEAIQSVKCDYIDALSTNDSD